MDFPRRMSLVVAQMLSADRIRATSEFGGKAENIYSR